ncbi:uncharacterized protein PAC_02973 [Phialocephala subalpina]|uniref:Uncharacterized protein n=1 Tax=Phialocephala subalpina TaxID=576137 RepID=A0A1L7WJY6_9HELO|nr:uncharacterized protein PAC_02973 [Phialocephala subalpina]
MSYISPFNDNSPPTYKKSYSEVSTGTVFPESPKMAEQLEPFPPLDPTKPSSPSTLNDGEFYGSQYQEALELYKARDVTGALDILIWMLDRLGVDHPHRIHAKCLIGQILKEVDEEEELKKKKAAGKKLCEIM